MRKVLLLILVGVSFSGSAAYTGAHYSKVIWVSIHNSDTIYFGLELMPSDHQCFYDYFTLSPTMTEKQRDRYYAMLLAARASGFVISVGYDKTNPDCVDDRPMVHALSY